MNFKDKKPKELTDEELYTLVSQISKITFLRNQSASLIFESEDCTQTALTTLYDRSARGKVGIEEIKEKPMDHFINILYRECSNTVNYQLRKKSTKIHLYNTTSLEEIYRSRTDKDDFEFGELICDEKNVIDELEEDIYTKSLLDRFSDESKDDKLSIVLTINNVKCSFSFSYKNIARAYLNLFNNRKVCAKDFKNVIVKKHTLEQINDNEIKKILNDFRVYVKREKLLEVGD